MWYSRTGLWGFLLLALAFQAVVRARETSRSRLIGEYGPNAGSEFCFLNDGRWGAKLLPVVEDFSRAISISDGWIPGGVRRGSVSIKVPFYLQSQAAAGYRRCRLGAPFLIGNWDNHGVYFSSPSDVGERSRKARCSIISQYRKSVWGLGNDKFNQRLIDFLSITRSWILGAKLDK
jgi:hypothetical protein